MTVGPITISKRGLVGLVVFGVVVLGLLFMSTKNTFKSDNTDGEYAAQNLPAFMSYNKQPYSPTPSTVSDNFIAEDLALFARSLYAEYSSDDRIPVEFIVTSSTEENGSRKIEGWFNKVDKKIDIFIEIKNNDRIKLSIKEVESGQSIDDKLNSNSVKNKFIGTLPITKADYIITFEPPDIVSISASFRDPEIFNEARSEIINLIGEDGLSQLQLSISYPTDGFLNE